MINYLLSRDHRRRKRELGLRILRQSSELRDSLIELKSLGDELADYYRAAGDDVTSAQARAMIADLGKGYPIKSGKSDVENLARVLLLVLPEEKS
jgi:hypothetical protein